MAHTKPNVRTKLMKIHSALRSNQIIPSINAIRIQLNYCKNSVAWIEKLITFIIQFNQLSWKDSENNLEVRIFTILMEFLTLAWRQHNIRQLLPNNLFCDTAKAWHFDEEKFIKHSQMFSIEKKRGLRICRIFQW